MTQKKTENPGLFSLMAGLTVQERQKAGERRRAFKAQGAEERLVKSGKAGWKLEYWIGKKKAGELNLT